MEDKPHVVIIGGGFGGLAAAKALDGAPVRVTVIDRSNHHLFQPLLYQVATSALAAPDIAAPIRKLLRSADNCTVLMAEVQRIDRSSRTVFLPDREIPYDYLILATGMVNSYFGHDQWALHAPGLKTLTDALVIRARILEAFEAAERALSDEERKALLTFVVIGGGPTGVEMAGALAEIATRTLASDFDHFDPARDTRVLLIEGADRLLLAYREESSARAATSLRELGVELRFGTFVTEVSEAGVRAGDELIPARTVVWAAGVRASPLTADLGVELDKAGRVPVEEDLTIPGDPRVFIVGDLIHRRQDGELLPGVAQLALQSGKYVGRTVSRRARDQGELVRPFRYRDKGSMATIGRHRAVAEVGRSRFSGFFAWLLWALIHVMFLVDFRNRAVVMIEWAYSYLTWRRSARVIIQPADSTTARAELRALLEQARQEGRTHVAEPNAAPAA